MPVHRGTTNRNIRGSSYARRKRKCMLLAYYGDGITAPCFSCEINVTYSMMEIDKIIPQAYGGTYAWDNIRPSCSDCNRRAGAKMQKLRRAGVPDAVVIGLCIEGVL